MLLNGLHIMVPVDTTIVGYTVQILMDGSMIRKYNVKLMMGDDVLYTDIYEDHPSYKEITKLLQTRNIDLCGESC
jgi:hypothetical protein